MKHKFTNVTKILGLHSSRLTDLAAAAGVDSKYFYVGATFFGVDVRGEDLSDVNLSGADFAGVIADSGTTVDKKYRRQLFQAAVDSVYRGQDLFKAVRARSPEDIVNAIVMLARAGDPKAELLLEVFNKNGVPPKFSSMLMVCDELSAHSRQLYYSKWIATYGDDPSAAIVLAVVCYEFETFPDVLRDSSNYVERFSGPEYSNYHIDRIVTTIAGTEQRQYVAHIENWCEKNLSNDKIVDVFDFYIVFDKMRTEKMGDIFASWLDSRSKKRNIGDLVRRSVGYFRMPSVEQAAARWVARNLRAPGVEALLITLMRGVFLFRSYLAQYCVGAG